MSLPVPYVSQGDDGNFCVPACLKMILDYLGKATGNPSLSFSLKQIARIIHTKSDGTDFDDVVDINKRLERVVPSVEFEVNPRPYNFKDIEHELANQRPVIAWLYISDANGGCCHSAVVTGYDRINQKIMINDPLRGQLSMAVGDFMDEWQKTSQTLIRLKLGTRIQRRMTEFTGQPEVEEGMEIAGQ